MNRYPYNLTIEEIRNLPNRWQRMVVEFVVCDKYSESGPCQLSRGEKTLCKLFQISDPSWLKKLKKGFPEAYAEFKKCYPEMFE